MGFLDENIFYAPEDLDFCMRIHKAGKKIWHLPDFTVNSTEIYLNNLSNIIEGTNITINATIRNLGTENSSVNVSFYDGNPSNGGVFIENDTLFVAFGAMNFSIITWTSQIGPNNIYVLIDQPTTTNGTRIKPAYCRLSPAYPATNRIR